MFFFLNHNAKIQHFSFPTHRCSMLLHDTQRLSLINIRVLPNGRKYRILAGDWTPCCSCCIHSSATAHRAGCILLSISSDGLLPRPGRNPENRAGLTPAWCNFVNPLTLLLMLNFSHTDLTDLTDFRLLRSFSIETKWEYPLLATKKNPWDPCGPFNDTIRNTQ